MINRLIDEARKFNGLTVRFSIVIHVHALGETWTWEDIFPYFNSFLAILIVTIADFPDLE